MKPCFLCRVMYDHDGPCLEADPIGALAHVVKQCGLTMTLHGEPVDARQLRTAALAEAERRISAAIGVPVAAVRSALLNRYGG